MRKFAALLLLLVLVVSASMVMAQETTPDPTITLDPTQTVDPTLTAEPTATAQPTDAGGTSGVGDATAITTDQMDAGQGQGQTVVVRFAHFVSDGAVLVPYIDGQPSAIQNLAFPSMTGWVQLPAESSIALIPEGAAQSQAVVGPLTLNASNSWTTIVVVGSAANNSIRAYAIRENVSAIPEGCALVSVFNAIEGGQAFDLVGDDNSSFGSGITFPGDMTSSGSDNANQSEMAMNDCYQTGSEMTSGDAQATEDASGNESVMDANMNTVGGAVDCVAITSTGMSISSDGSEMDTTGSMDAQATAEATAMTGSDAEATEDASMRSSAGTSTGNRFANCAYTFVARPESLNVNANGVGDASTLFNFTANQFLPNTYNFVALVGTAGAPQVFTYSVSTSTLSDLLVSNGE